MPGMRTLLAAMIAIVVLGGTAAGPSAQTASLKGTWEIVETISVQGQHDAASHPSLYIFTDKYYSIQWVTGPRAVPEGRAMTEQETFAAWRLLIAHAGTYDVKGSQLSMQPIVAKNPGVMASNGGHSTAEIRFDGSSTVYITATDPTGATIKLHRVE
jgi:hypothetical protein